MRVIAVIKKCLDDEKNMILSATDTNDKIMFFDNENELLNSDYYEKIDIIFGEPEIKTIKLMKNLRWIQMTWAGANKYTSIAKFPDNITVTSASGAYGFVISEYIISGILALYKNLFLYRLQIKSGDWDKIEGNETLEGKRVLILGTGDIGKETAKKLKCFGAYTVGICRTNKNTLSAFDEMYTFHSLDSQLQVADIVVVALPGTDETRSMINADRLKLMKSDSIIVNVGRGFIVDTDNLTKALQNGLIKGAVLDVTEPEPLPTTHPLRNMENVLLTPHISGISWGENKFTRKRILEIFCENIKRDKLNQSKKNIIDFNKGY